MPKVNDIKEYWKELAKKQGIDDDSMKPILEALDKEGVRKAFSEGFKPLPDYSFDLDSVRERTRQEKDNEYKEWHEKELQKYNEYVKSVELLQQYEQRYGKLNQQQQQQASQQLGLTKEQLDEILNERLSRRDSAYMDLLEVRESHLGTFKKPLDVKAFEEAWHQHPEWGGSMKAAYKFYVEPEVEKLKEAEWENKLKARYDEGLRDGFTRKSLPGDHASKTFSPLFDRQESVSKLSEAEQERHSREAFLEGLRG